MFGFGQEEASEAQTNRGIRGAYCAAVIITLLRLPLDLTPESPAYAGDGSVNLLTGVADYVRRCKQEECASPTISGLLLTPCRPNI